MTTVGNADNPLIAARQDSTEWYTGVGIAEGIADLAGGVSSGSWVDISIGGVATGLEALAFVTDPVGSLVAYGVAWLMEHVKPLSDALDWLAGDPDQIAAFAQTWRNVSASMTSQQQALATAVAQDIAHWTGTAAAAYRGNIASQQQALGSIGQAASTIGMIVEGAGLLVALVRELVRDLIAEFVSVLAARLPQWLAEEGLTLGIATPWVIGQVSALVSKWVAKIGRLLNALVSSINRLMPILRKLGDFIDELSALLKRLRSAPGSTPDLPGTKVNSPGTPDGPGAPNRIADHSTSTSDTTPVSDKTCATDPVDVATGAVLLTQADVRLPGLLPVILSRTHCSSYRAGRWFGPSWASTLDQRIEVDRAGGVDGAGGADGADGVPVRVCLTTADGMMLHYPPPPADGSPVHCQRGPRWPLRRVGDDAGGTPTNDAPGTAAGTAAGYTVEDPALGWTWHYAQPEGVASVEGLYPLVALTDRLGHRIDVLYAPSGMIAELRHTGGYRILVDTAGGRITGLHLGTGTPSEAPGSAPVPAPESNPGPAPASPSGSTPEQTPEPTPEPQLLVRFAYDSAGNLSEVIDPERASQRFTYDAAGRMTTWADRNGSRYRYTYNVSGRCIRTNGPDGFMSARFIYGSGTTTLIDSLGHRTVYHLDGRGKVTKTADPLGNTAQRRFDENDQLIEAIDPLGRATTYTRDSNGDIVAIRRPDGRNAIVRYTALRQPAMVAGFDQSVWQREYDEIGNLLTATGPDGATIRYTYDGCGHLATITDPLGATTVVSCDAAGLPLRVTDPTGATTAYRRDHAGRVVAITDPLGATTRLTYTVDGKITSRTLPDGTAETWEYDGEGNLTAHTGPTGAATRFEYTHFDLPAARIEPDGTRLAFGYDSELRLTSVTNPQGLVWSYEYDPAGRLVAETDFNSRRLAYTIDAAGQLTSKVNGLRQTLSFEYDSLGHLVAKYTPEGVTRYAYDPAGRLLRAQAPGSDLAITRDALGRIVAETINGQTLHTTRDVLGRVAERRTPSGVTSTWTYDARHQPSSLTAAGHTMRFTHDAAGRQVGRHVAGEGPWLRFDQSFDPADRLLSQTVTAGLSDRPDAAASAPWELARRTYTYRADGALTAIDDATTGRRTLALDQAGRVTAVQAAAWSERYAYDSAGNLVHASSGALSGAPSGMSPGASLAAGQGDHGTAPDREFEYSGTLVRRAGNVRYQHDAGGRVALKQRPRHSAKPDTWYYTWDSEDRLTAVRVPDGTWWTYRYDPLGRRISKRHLTSDGQVLEQTGYAWEGTRLAEQTRYPGGGLPWVTTTFDYQVESHVPIAQTTTSPGQAAHGRPGPQREASWAIARPDGPGYADGPRADLPTPAPLPTTQEEFDQRFYAIVTDLVGTPTELVSPGEGIAWQARATIWGTTAAVSPAGVDCPLRFPGQYYDPETQDHYNFFRYYDPATGRYQSPDPIGLIGGSDPHQYVPNPTGWIDPLGLSPCTSQGDSFEGPGPWDLRGRDPMSVVPDHASVRELTPVPGGSQYGLEFKWVDSQGRTVRLRIHGPDASAPPGSHSASGETYRIQISGRYQDEAGNLYHKNVHNPASPFYDPTAANATHIPWPPGYVGL